MEQQPIDSKMSSRPLDALQSRNDDDIHQPTAIARDCKIIDLFAVLCAGYSVFYISSGLSVAGMTESLHKPPVPSMFLFLLGSTLLMTLLLFLWKSRVRKQWGWVLIALFGPLSYACLPFLWLMGVMTSTTGNGPDTFMMAVLGAVLLFFVNALFFSPVVIVVHFIGVGLFRRELLPGAK